MSSAAPRTDLELLARWEWFRRAGWGEDGAARSLCGSFAELARESGASVCLEADCGFAADAMQLKRMGLGMVCCDESAYIIDRARENVQARGEALPFFVSSLQKLPENAPHQFDAVYCPSLMLEPEWQVLREKFAGIFKVLKPGGFLAFTGPTEGGNWARLLEEYRKAPREEALWSFREGGVGCTKVVVREGCAENFADERLLHVIDDNGNLRVESTVRRLPAYWSWEIILDLARQSGYCHVQTRRFTAEGGKQTALNVAWKDGNLREQSAPARELSPYADR